MNKKEYQKPTMKVVKLQHQCQILAGSLTTTRDAYGMANDGVNSSETDSDGNWLWE